MQPPIPHHQWKLRSVYAKLLNERVAPNIAVTVTLCQGRSYENAKGRSWRDGEPILFEELLRDLVRRLSKTIYGSRAYAKYGKRIAAGGVVEGDEDIQDYHLHAHLRRPDWMTFEKFERAIKHVWLQSPWLKADLDVQEIHGKWVWYTTKRGPEHLIFP
jgi:hypothetical protein